MNIFWQLRKAIMPGTWTATNYKTNQPNINSKELSHSFIAMYTKKLQTAPSRSV